MTMIFLKQVSENGLGIIFVVKDNQKNLVCTGNIPKLYSGMSIGLELTYEPEYKMWKVNNYEYSDTKRNRSILEKHEVDIDEFHKKLAIHKKTGLLWKELKNVDNPYSYYSFAEADRISKALGYPSNDPRRLEKLLDETIQYFRSNRTWQYTTVEFIDGIRRIEKNGAYNELTDTECLKMLMTERLSYSDKLSDNEVLQAKDFTKTDIYKRKTRNRSFVSEADIDRYLSINAEFSEEQKNAVRMLKNTRPAALGGGAGSGKTTTIRAITGAFLESHDEEDICMLAPTGRAARRITESTGIKATTIHSRLRETPDSDFVFYNRNNPLPQKLFIIDESSMIDDLLMADLLRAIPEDAKIYLIGDCNQLYPVGVGEPFHEIIKGNACDVVLLTKNFRQKDESKILWNANRILENKGIEAGQGFIIEHIEEKDIIKFAGEDSQNISPYNEVNDRINRQIVRKYTKSEDLKIFFKGEKVVATKNTKEFANGEIGVVTKVEQEDIVVKFDSNVCVIENKDLDLIVPAYSLTVHKTQGSEYESVNLFLPEKATSFITRRLVYTAITRAKQNVNLYLYK